MAQSYFVWNGIDCRSKGVITQGHAAIIRAEERVNHVTIPGRSGDLTETEGENIYNSYIQTVSIVVRGGMHVREIYQWLRGSGYVTFSGEPDRQQKARVIGAITLNRHSRNLDYWTGEVQFYCQPLKELIRPETATVTSSGSAVRNRGDVTSHPMWKVTASGSGVTLTAGGNTITVSSLSSGQIIWIDSDTMEVWNGAKDTLLTVNSAGDFPVLEPGANTITGTGWSKVEIDKRERYL